MRILIYGAGVIGSLYGAILAEAGFDVTVYARGNRLKILQEYGLRYMKKRAIRVANITVLSRLGRTDIYDYILLTVRENQLLAALEELKENDSPTIVTMVNSIDSYDEWEGICGEGRILPAFPGAGGGFKDDILDAALTPRLIQPTTVGKTDGREKELANIFRKAGIPCQLVENMHVWQICHLAMVVPIADAYYAADDPANAGKDRALMKKTAIQLRKNFRGIADMGLKLSPSKMNVFRFLPIPLISAMLGYTFQSRFGNQFMYQHAVKAPDEMRHLHEQFYGYMQKKQSMKKERVKAK